MMSYDKTILIIGTYDTKSDELIYLAERILSQGAKVLTMDISVLGIRKVKLIIANRMSPLRPVSLWNRSSPREMKTVLCS